MKTIAFFNTLGGVGKTSLVYHLAWMYRDLGVSVVAVDLDPQCNLTSMFLEEERVKQLWADGEHALTIYGAIRPLLEGTGDVAVPHVEGIDDDLGLVVGDVALWLSEEELSNEWPRALIPEPRAFRVLSTFWRVIDQAARKRQAALALIDVAPSLGAINRAALIAVDGVVIPLESEHYSLQGLKTLGPTLRRWRGEWEERRARNPVSDLSIPCGEMAPLGYIVMQEGVRLDRPMKAYDHWITRIPAVYREAVLGRDPIGAPQKVSDDTYCLAALKHYRSLMSLALEARKPMFLLTPADGAIGGLAQAVRECHRDFRNLALEISARAPIVVPSPVGSP
jgi:cellulose biosynthesis protein BcsQ